MITKLPRIEGAQLKTLQNWCRANKKLMTSSSSTYAKGRSEMPVRLRVGLGKNPTATPVGKSISSITKPIEEIGEKLLPGFHQGLILWYPTGTRIGIHRDAPAYALIKGKPQGLAAQINVIGNCIFQISSTQNADELERFQIGEGDCFQFDNKQPHGIDYVQQERWCFCFFYLKSEVLSSLEKPKQVELFEPEKPAAAPFFYDDDDDDDTESWIKRFPNLSPKAPADYNPWPINWVPAVGKRVFVPIDNKSGEVTKIDVNTACAGLTGVWITYDDGSKDCVYAHQCKEL